MDLSKVDRIHQALSATLVITCTEESATPSEAMTVGMRLFSHLLAAYVADADHSPRAMRREEGVEALGQGADRRAIAPALVVDRADRGPHAPHLRAHRTVTHLLQGDILLQIQDGVAHRLLKGRQPTHGVQLLIEVLDTVKQIVVVIIHVSPLIGPIPTLVLPAAN